MRYHPESDVTRNHSLQTDYGVFLFKIMFVKINFHSQSLLLPAVPIYECIPRETGLCSYFIVSKIYKFLKFHKNNYMIHNRESVQKFSNKYGSMLYHISFDLWQHC